MLGIFGRNKPKRKPSYERGGYSKPTRLPGVAKKWQPPVKEPGKPEAPASRSDNPDNNNPDN